LFLPFTPLISLLVKRFSMLLIHGYNFSTKEALQAISPEELTEFIAVCRKSNIRVKL